MLFEERALLRNRQASLRRALAALHEVTARTAELAEAARVSRDALRATIELKQVFVRARQARPASQLTHERVTPARDEADAEVQRPGSTVPAGEALRPAEQNVVDALAWLEVVGLSPACEAAVACVAGYRARSAGWLTLRRTLCRRELVVQVDGASQLALASAGRRHASPLERARTDRDLYAALALRLEVPERRILRALLVAHPISLGLADLARSCRWHRDDEVFTVACNRLLAIGLVVLAPSGQLVVNAVLLRFGPPASADLQVWADATGLPPATRMPRLVRGGLQFVPSGEPG